MKKFSDMLLTGLIRFAHETMGLTPNAISVGGFVVGLAAALLVAGGLIPHGLALMAIAQILDGLDGGVARMYNMGSALGQKLEVIFDRLSEFVMFMALAYAGQVSYRMALLAFTAILLATAVEPYSKFDPGFKRFMLYFGYAAGLIFAIRGLEIAMHVIFIANLAAVAAGTVIADYRLQREIDDAAILRRKTELLMGVPQPPDDPPSLLSRLFS
jgi:phosphatidylglycerophosphate synthase